MNGGEVYMVPIVEIVEFDHEECMTAMSVETDDSNIGSGTAGDGPELANQRRGTWGDLWAEPETDPEAEVRRWW